MVQFQENARTYKDGRKDRQTLFYRTLSATTGGPKNYMKMWLEMFAI